MKKSRKVTVLLAAILSLTMLTSCSTGSESKAGNQSNSNSSANSVESTTDDTKESTDESSKETSATEDETKEETSDESTADTSPIIEVELSDNLFDFEVGINGEKYQLPMSYKDFTAKGWSCNKSYLTQKLGKNGHMIGVKFKNGDIEMVTQPANLTDKEITVEESSICYMKFDKYMEAQIQISKGIVLDRSTLSDVKKAYGEPNTEKEASNGRGTTIKYREDTFISYSLTFDENDILMVIVMENRNI